LQSDKGYNGPAFNLSVKCKNVMLDSLTISNFKTGIASFNSTLALKNTRFINCLTPVQTALTIADKKYINGRAPFFKADSVPVTAKLK